MSLYGSAARGTGHRSQSAAAPRNVALHMAEELALFERDDPAQRQIPAAVEHFFCFRQRSCKAMQNRRSSFWVFGIGDLK